MREWNVVDVFGKGCLYGVGGISVKIDGFVEVSRDVVEGLLVGNGREVIMGIVDEDGDGVLVLGLVCGWVIGRVVLVKMGGDSKVYGLCLDKCVLFCGG